MTSPTKPVVLPEPAYEAVDEEFDEEGPSRNTRAAIGVLMTATSLALTTLALDYRAGIGEDFAGDAAHDLYGRIATGFQIGQSEFLDALRSFDASYGYAHGVVYDPDGQIAYLREFEDWLRNNPGDDAVAARSTLYEGSIWGGFQAGRVEGARESSGGRATAVWVKDDIDTSCEDCEALDGQEWDIEEIPQFPGDGSTQCLGNCRCKLELIAGGGDAEA